MRTKGTAAILAFLLGGFGAHKFYLGQTFQGLLYLFFCWTLIPALIAFLEVFVYLSMSPVDFDTHYNGMQYVPAQGQGGQMAQNITVNIPGGGGPAAGGDITEQLTKLNELRLAGVLDEDEFRQQKRRLLEA